MAIDLSQTRSYLTALTGSPDTKVTWQWFADPPALKGDKSLCGHRHGSLDDLAPMLTALNAKGAGIFVTVNATDGEGRKSENVTGLRALFVDDDTNQELRCLVPPNIRVRSKRGEQWYWTLEDGEELALFRPAQLALASHFKTDTSITDLPRVMRVPGFEHRKGDPFDVKVVGTNDGGPYTIRGLLADMGLELVTPKERKQSPAPVSAPGKTAYGAAALASECAKITSQQEGGRHKAIFAAAAAVAELVAGGQLDRGHAESAIRSAARQASNNGDRKIDDGEIDQAIADGWARGETHPRGPDDPPPHDDMDAPPEIWERVEDGHPTEADIAAVETTKPKAPDRLRAVTQAEALAMWDASKQRQSIPTGISSLDQAIGGGLPAGQVTIVLGYTGTGKSEFCRQIRRRVAESGNEVVHVDVELGAARVLERDLSQACQIPAAILRGGDLSRQEQDAAEAGRARIISQTGIKTISPGGGLPLDLLTKAIDQAIGDDHSTPRLLILDSMQRLAVGAKGDNPRMQVSNFSNWVCWYAQTRNVAVLMTSEQHRGKEGGRPTASDMLTSGAESRSIEFQADILIGLVPKTKPEDDTAGPCDSKSQREVDVLIAKNRHGNPGYIRSTLVFKAPCWDMSLETRGASDVLDAVYDKLTDEPQPLSVIRKAVARNKSSVLSALTELVAENRAILLKNGDKPVGYHRFQKPGTDGAVIGSKKYGTDWNRSEKADALLRKVNGSSIPAFSEPMGTVHRFQRGVLYNTPADQNRSKTKAEVTPLGLCIERQPGEDDDL